MLLEFSVENYLSFKEKTTFSMLASNDKKLENNYVPLNKYNILKTTSIYGANASGKSNLFKALNFFVQLVKNSNYMEPDKKIDLSQFGGYLKKKS